MPEPLPMTQPATPLLRTAAFALLIAMGVAGAAEAQMRSPDTNHDGVVSRAESQAGSDARFKRMDANKDGVVDAAELAKVKSFIGSRSPKMIQMLDRLDANGDGKVTKAEADAAHKLSFDKTDANHDGQLDKAELDAVRKAMGAP